MEQRVTTPDWLHQMIDRQENDSRLDAVAEKLQPAMRPLGDGQLGETLRGKWLGHRLHPLLTDLPIGFFTSAFVLDLVGGKRSRTAARRLIGLGLISTVPTAMAGAVDLEDASSDPKIRRVGVVHGLGNAVAALMYFRSWRSRRRGHHLRGVLFGVAGGVLMSFTGHLGGHLSMARGANVGTVTPESSREEAGVVDLTGGAAGRLLDAEEVATRLGLSVDDVQVMVDEQVLVPAHEDGSTGFRPEDVEAARLQGG